MTKNKTVGVIVGLAVMLMIALSAHEYNNLAKENEQLRDEIETIQEQDNIEELELRLDVALREKEIILKDLWDTKEQLRISNDQLKMIEMRNEGIEYQEDAE